MGEEPTRITADEGQGPAVAPAPPIPARLGPYRLEHELGRGGMGVVYLARDTRLDRPAAIKALPAALAADAEWLNRFRREARLLASLSHPNITTVYGLEESDGAQFLVMEYVDGETLAQRLKQGCLPPAEVARIGVQIAAGLEAAHEAGVVHCDLKPANVKLDSRSRVKVLDFGLARRTSGGHAPAVTSVSITLTLDGAQTGIAGTPGYMSPEQVRGAPQDARTDIFAFGCVLFECLTGQPAFSGQTANDRMAAVLLSAPDWKQLPADISPALRTLLEQCLAKNPADRLNAIGQVRTVLETILQGIAIHTGGGAATGTTFAGLTGAPTVASIRGTIPHNLPRRLSSFIGRAAQLDELRQLLDTARLLTLSGAGGCGKTRLVLKLAESVLANWPDGAYFVELAPVTDPNLVPRAFLDALGLKEQAGQTILRTLLEHLEPKTVLLLVDNCEHLLDESAWLIGDLLATCPNMKILATSRAALGLDGETVYRVPALSLPALRNADNDAEFQSFSQCEAVTLFVERARAAKPGFALTPAAAPLVARICRRLDGLPLALELAAARVKALTLEQIHAKLDDCFRLLTGGSRTALPHHQTLYATIDWSYELLSDGEKRLLRRLSLFTGGWSLDAAENICSESPPGQAPSEPQPQGRGQMAESAGDVFDLLAHLVDKSLVIFDETPDGQGRYRMLETVRQYAREKLAVAGERATACEHHFRYFLALTEQAESNLTKPEQKYWLDRLETEHENLLAALEWGQNSDLPSEPRPQGRGLEVRQAALRLAGALALFWNIRGYWYAGRSYLAAALARDAAARPTLARAKVLHGAGVLAFAQNDYAPAQNALQEALALRQTLDDPPGTATTLHYLGVVARRMGDYATARARLEQAVALRRDLGDRHGIAVSLACLGDVAQNEGDAAAAHAIYREALPVFRELGDRRGLAISLYRLGKTAANAGDWPAARERFAESLAFNREVDDKEGIALALTALGTVAREQGDFAAAKTHYAQALDLWLQLGGVGFFTRMAELVGGLAAQCGAPDLAARLFGFAARARETGGAPSAREPIRPTSEPRPTRAEPASEPRPARAGPSSELERNPAAILTALDAATFQKEWETGRALSETEALAAARAWLTE